LAGRSVSRNERLDSGRLEGLAPSPAADGSFASHRRDLRYLKVRPYLFLKRLLERLVILVVRDARRRDSVSPDRWNFRRDFGTQIGAPLGLLLRSPGLDDGRRGDLTDPGSMLFGESGWSLRLRPLGSLIHYRCGLRLGIVLDHRLFLLLINRRL
jgi:hypothetical protein